MDKALPKRDNESHEQWRLDLGGRRCKNGVRVWARRRERVKVVVEGTGGGEWSRDAASYFCAKIPGLFPGCCYHYRLDGGEIVSDP